MKKKEKTNILLMLSGSDGCPVTSFEKYIAHLNPNREDLWQRPRRHMIGPVWYDDSAVGKDTLGNFVKEISRLAECSKEYTNHNLRATCITKLDDAGVEARHITTVSGHKREETIRKNYSTRTHPKKKREMSNILANSLAVNAENDQLAIQVAPEPNTAQVQSAPPVLGIQNQPVMPQNGQMAPAAPVQLQGAQNELFPNVEPENQDFNLLNVDLMALSDSQEKALWNMLFDSANQSMSRPLQINHNQAQYRPQPHAFNFPNSRVQINYNYYGSDHGKQ